MEKREYVKRLIGVAQQLRELVAFLEDLGSVPSTLIEQLRINFDSSSGVSNIFFWSPQALR